MVCSECIPGSAQPELGQSACIPCPPHSHSALGGAACACDSGYYASALPEQGEMGECLACPMGSSCEAPSEYGDWYVVGGYWIPQD
jgi:hypothetical protein